MIINQIKEAIGNTPLLRFTSSQLPIPNGTEIFAKLEFLNPGGSIKDRLGQYLVSSAVQSWWHFNRAHRRKYRHRTSASGPSLWHSNDFCGARKIQFRKASVNAGTRGNPCTHTYQNGHDRSNKKGKGTRTRNTK